MSPLKTDATPPPSPPAKKARADDAIKVLTDEEYNEQFTRTSALLSASGQNIEILLDISLVFLVRCFTDLGFEKFNGKKVAIIGCGGVGWRVMSGEILLGII